MGNTLLHKTAHKVWMRETNLGLCLFWFSLKFLKALFRATICHCHQLKGYTMYLAKEDHHICRPIVGPKHDNSQQLREGNDADKKQTNCQNAHAFGRAIVVFAACRRSGILWNYTDTVH